MPHMGMKKYFPLNKMLQNYSVVEVEGMSVVQTPFSNHSAHFKMDVWHVFTSD